MWLSSVESIGGEVIFMYEILCFYTCDMTAFDIFNFNPTHIKIVS